MKKAQREPYVALAGVCEERTGYVLCTWCKFLQGDYGSPCNDDGGFLECLHPLEAVNEECFGEGVPTDCWGFRPRYSIKIMADTVGILLQGYFPNHWAYGDLPTPSEVRRFERLVIIGEVTPWRAKKEVPDGR